MKNKFTLVLLLFAAQIVLAQIPSNGLVAYFPFSGNANDQSGSGITGTPTGGGFPVGPAPLLTADRNSVANSAYEFLSQTGYSTTFIDLGTHAVFNFDSTSSFSISLWMKYVVYQVSSTMIGNDQWHLGIRNLGGSDHLNLVAGTTSFNSDSLLHPGAWVHVAGVYNRANKTLELYINGTLATGFAYNGSIYGPQGQASMSTDNCALCLLNSMPSVNTKIGMSTAISTNFTGVLDDILFYNRALSGNEVGNIFTATGGPSGIEETTRPSAFKVVPNTGNGLFTVQMSEAITQHASLKVYNVQGQLLMQQKSVSENQPIDLSGFSTGNYLVKLETETGFYTQKVSVVK